MAGEDFDPGTPQQALPQDQPAGRAADMSQPSNLRKAWDAWTSRPENNAAMINFGLSLMQPIQPGQSRLGHWGEAIGAGAEASQRNVKEQREREAEEVAQEQKERALDIKERETGYYGEAVRQRGAQGAGGLKGEMAVQAAARKRMAAFDNDITGLSEPGAVAAIKQMNPKWAKYGASEIQRDPEASREMAKYILARERERAQILGTELGEAGGGGGAPAVPPGSRIAVSKDGSRIWQDPTTGKWNPM